MTIKINVRLCCGSYLARAMGLGVTASSAESPHAAAQSVCRKAGIDPQLLEQIPADAPVIKFQNPGEVMSS
ncbi:hypothetical protein [Pseudomonas donghuensis]|uniref:hypothetical protein n=1 Tax=Pseudomonas donghuensis TaxID=1163398 RepID=UPI00215F5078|nr:hypothetical protein [Pseudomonas donghuensis]UVL22427.1 hypothetical protein LOY30_16325 [Pseudomonas donghuensis]